MVPVSTRVFTPDSRMALATTGAWSFGDHAERAQARTTTAAASDTSNIDSR